MDKGKELMAFYNEIKKDIPDMNYLTFSVGQVNQQKAPYWQGYLHRDGYCFMFNSIEEFYEIIARRKILFQKFGRV